MNRDEPESLAAQAAAWVPPWQRHQPDPRPTPDHPGDEPPAPTGTAPEPPDPPATSADQPPPGNDPTDPPQPAEVPADAGSDGSQPTSDDAPAGSEPLPVVVAADTDEPQPPHALPDPPQPAEIDADSDEPRPAHALSDDLADPLPPAMAAAGSEEAQPAQALADDLATPLVAAGTDEAQPGSALPDDLAPRPDSAPAESSESPAAVEDLDGGPIDQDLNRPVREETDDSLDSDLDSKRPAAPTRSTDPHTAAPTPSTAPAEPPASSNGASPTGAPVDQPSTPIPTQAEDSADAVPATDPHPSEADHQPPLPDTVDLPAALEAILLVVDEPVPEIVLAQVLEQPTDTVAAALTRLSEEYTEAGRGYDLRRAAGGWRLYTRPEYAPYVERFVLDGQQVRLTQASLETLAVIAYKQPVTRSRISAIRGVNCDGVIRTLLTRGLIEECGSEPDTGAHLYRTSMLFCEKLGIDSPADLPPLAPFLPDDVNEIAEAHDQR